MDNEKTRVGLIEDLRGYGRRVPLSLNYDGAIKEWVALWRKDTKFREYVHGTVSPLDNVSGRPKLSL